VKSRTAWFALCLGLPLLADGARAQPAPTPAPSAAPAPVPAPVPSAPAPQAAPTAQPVPAAPVAIPPPKYRVPPPQIVYTFKEESIRPKRRYGDAGAPFAIGIGGTLRFRSDPGYEKLDAEDRQAELELFGSYDVLQPIRRIVIAAGISYRHLDLGDEDSVAVITHAVQADVIARYTLTRWLFPHVRAGIGAQLSRAELHDDSGDLNAHDRTSGVTGSLGAGLTLQTPPRLFETYRGRLSSLSVGLLLEGGYAFAASAKYQLEVDSDSDLESPAVTFGNLDLGGPYLRIAGVVRF
jgi:hypothetical protein